MKLQSAMIVTIILSFLTRIGLGAILITASQELDTQALRLASAIVGVWIILMAIRRTIILWRGYLKMFAKTE